MGNRDLLSPGGIYRGDARTLLARVAPASVALSFWSPPYFVGKSYEAALDFAAWSELLRETIAGHSRVIAPGGFLAVNIADILAFADPEMPRIQADNVSAKKVKITREQVLAAQRANPDFDKYQLAALLGCSEQTIDRRLKNNNARGGKYASQTRVRLTAGLVEQWAADAGFYLYDRRVWVKDPCWENSRWHSLSYRAVDEFEHLLIFLEAGHNGGEPGTVGRGRVGGMGIAGGVDNPVSALQRRPRIAIPAGIAAPDDPVAHGTG